MQDPGLPPSLHLDLELLARLRPDSPRSDWERTLRRTGLLSLRPSESQAGRLIADIQAQFEASAAPDRAIVQADTPLKPMDTRSLQGIALAGIALLILAAVYQHAGVALFGALLLGGAAWLWRLPGEQQQRLSNKNNQIYANLQNLLSLSFIEPMGGTVVESTPHRELILLRLDQLAQADQRVQGHIEDVEVMLHKISDLNEKIGSSREDAKTIRLRERIQSHHALRAQIQRQHKRLSEALRAVDARLERRRALALRAALSEQAGRLVEPSADLAAAEAEVDLLEVDQEIKRLDLQEIQDTLQLRALLEVSALR